MPDSDDFAIDISAMSTALLPNESTTFTVTFAPTAIGARTAMLHIASNDADENPFDIASPRASVSGQANALHFDGVDDQVEAQLKRPLFGPNSTTIEFWAKAPTRFSFPLSVEGNFLSVIWGPQLGFNEFFGSSFQTGYALNNCWHHIAFTYDGASGTMYAFVDGQPTPNPSHPGPWHSTSALTVASPRHAR